MTYVSQTEKKQVTVRMTEQFAKDLNLLLSCNKGESVSGVVQDAVHQLAEYYRFCMARKQDARQDVTHSPGRAVLCPTCKAEGKAVCV